MPSLPAWNRTPACAVGVAALLAVAIWAGEARAGCGDHVVILKKADGTPGDSPKPPCRGPNCSLSPPAPLPLLPAPVSPSTPSHDAVLAGEPPADPVRDDWIRLDHLPPSSGRPADIFHPPRPC